MITIVKEKSKRQSYKIFPCVYLFTLAGSSLVNMRDVRRHDAQIPLKHSRRRGGAGAGGSAGHSRGEGGPRPGSPPPCRPLPLYNGEDVDTDYVVGLVLAAHLLR